MQYPKCPATYFGKGEDFVLPEDIEIVREFEQNFENWVDTHPDDPTGEKELALWKELQKEKKKHVPRFVPVQTVAVECAEILVEAKPILSSPKLQKAMQQKIVVEPLSPSVDEEMTELTLKVPTSIVEKLKVFANAKRRRPRDIIIAWIKELTNMGDV